VVALGFGETKMPIADPIRVVTFTGRLA